LIGADAYPSNAAMEDALANTARPDDIAPARHRNGNLRPGLIGQRAVGPVFPAVIDWKGSPKFAGDGPIFAVDLDDEPVGSLKARKGSGISVKLLR
jgi:hypothetical protein